MALRGMGRVRGFAAGLALLALAGCADLAAVRSFSRSSAAAARSEAVLDDYARSPARAARYQPEPFRRQLDELAARRAEQRKRLEAAQASLAGYLSALGDLAADEVPRVDADMDRLVEELEGAKFVGDGDGQVGTETATAAAGIAKLLLRALADRWRQQRLVELIRQADPHLQAVVAGLSAVVDQDLRTSLDQEAEAVRKPFLGWRAAAAAHGDPDGAPRVAAILMEERLAALDDRRAALDAYRQALASIGQGHADLAQHVDRLGKKELADRLAARARDLAALARAVRKLAG